jgi:hypothetical protein
MKRRLTAVAACVIVVPTLLLLAAQPAAAQGSAKKLQGKWDLDVKRTVKEAGADAAELGPLAEGTFKMSIEFGAEGKITLTMAFAGQAQSKGGTWKADEEKADSVLISITMDETKDKSEKAKVTLLDEGAAIKIEPQEVDSPVKPPTFYLTKVKADEPKKNTDSPEKKE